MCCSRIGIAGTQKVVTVWFAFGVCRRPAGRRHFHEDTRTRLGVGLGRIVLNAALFARARPRLELRRFFLLPRRQVAGRGFASASPAMQMTITTTMIRC